MEQKNNHYEKELEDFWKMIDGIPHQHTVKGLLELEKRLNEKGKIMRVNVQGGLPGKE